MKIGRNDPCPCGSGKKYKRCHLGKESDLIKPKKKYRHFSGVVFDDSATKFSLYKKNMTLVEGIIDIFGFTEGKDLSEIKRKVSRDHVAELHKLVAWLWPPDTNITDFLPTPSKNLRALYLGNMRPQTILRSVGRYSLYCDEILVMDPFMNPWFIAPDYNPIMHPDEYVSNTWKWVLFTIQLAPWIYDKQVFLLPDPLDFDSALRKEMWQQAEKRLDPHKKDFMNFLKGDDAFTEIARDDFKRSLMSMPENAMRRNIKKFKPSMTDREVDEMIKYIDKQKEVDPYFITNPNEKGALGISTHTMGGNLEQGLYISQLTGSYLYTDFELRWREILSTKNEGNAQNPWSPLTYAFQNLDFKFLDGVDLKFIHKIKGDGRLSSFRNYLRKTWNVITEDKEQSYNQIHSLAKDFADELKEENTKAQFEWKDIDHNLQKWLLSRNGLGSLLVATGAMEWVTAGLGFSLDGVNNLLQARYARKKFKSNVPLSVFVDLENKRAKPLSKFYQTIKGKLKKKI